MKILWNKAAWESYVYWQTQDKKTLKRINNLLLDISRNGYDIQGKPEALRYDYSGWWSAKIDNYNRLVFRISENGYIEVISCQGHYR
jgi:toxin YoeB